MFRQSAHCARFAHVTHRHCRIWALGSEISRHIFPSEKTPQQVGPTIGTGTRAQSQTTTTIFMTEGPPASRVPGKCFGPTERSWIPARTPAMFGLRRPPMQLAYWGATTLYFPIQFTWCGTKEWRECSRNHRHQEPTVSESNIQVKGSGLRPQAGAAGGSAPDARKRNARTHESGPM